jgi:DNA primase
MDQQWIDFKALREQLDFAAVLRHYGVELRRKKDQLTGFCPLPNHNGQRKSPSFSVNLHRKIWQCFGCGRGGNVLDFAILMEGRDPKDRRAVRDVALLLRERFGLDAGQSERPAGGGRTSATSKAPAPGQASLGRSESDEKARESTGRANAHPAVVVNAPLDFELRGLDPNHPYLLERGFTKETIRHFGLGFCNRGLMAGRVVIPLHDHGGNRIGYAGRFTRDDQVCEKVPKYLFPGDRERNGIQHEFRKSLFLYNGHTIKAPVRDLVLLEGFPSVWWLHQCGFPDTVALMGNSCSPEQRDLILQLVAVSGRIWLMPDAGEGGERCAENVLPQLSPHRFVKWVRLDDGQPTDLAQDDLVRRLEWKVVP